MPCYEVTQLQSEIEVIETLQSFLNAAQNCDTLNEMQTEWKTIEQHLSKILQPLGKEGWDFILMDWPADVPLFNVTLNNSRLSSALSLNDLTSLLTTLHLPWCIRIEQRNRIQNGLMVGGEALSNVLVTQSKVHEWKAETKRG